MKAKVSGEKKRSGGEKNEANSESVWSGMGKKKGREAVKRQGARGKNKTGVKKERMKSR